MWALLLLLLSTTDLTAYEQDYLPEMSDEEYRQVGPRLYRAEGEHQCQSSSSIGHSCKNLGVNFTDCHQAALKLKRDDCCRGSTFGGLSLNFKLTKCTNFN
jgi:hypothetical protein